MRRYGFGIPDYYQSLNRVFSAPIPKFPRGNEFESEKQFANFIYARDDAAKTLAKKYEIGAWVSINQFVSISWDTWLELTDLTRRAIALEVEEIARQRNNSHKQQEEKLERLMAEESSKLKFPNQVGSTINRFLS
jgi:hypothetical protein